MSKAKAKRAYEILYSDLNNCGCGFFEDRLSLLREVLRAFPLYEKHNLEYLNTPLGEWFLVLLDGSELIEHGPSIGSAWLSSKGQEFLSLLNDEEVYAALIGDEPVGFPD